MVICWLWEHCSCPPTVFFTSFTCSILKPVQKCKIWKQIKKKKKLFHWRSYNLIWWFLKVFYQEVENALKFRFFPNLDIFQIIIKKSHSSLPSPYTKSIPIPWSDRNLPPQSACCLVQRNDTHSTQQEKCTIGLKWKVLPLGVFLNLSYPQLPPFLPTFRSCLFSKGGGRLVILVSLSFLS